MTARVQFASFAKIACDINSSVISGNLTADKAGTYYFWLSYRNDVGFNRPSANSISVTVAEDEGIRITLPSAAYQAGENIWQYFISVNTVDDASTARVLLVIDAQTASQLPIGLPLNIDITQDEHLETEKTVTTANLPSGSDLLNGIIRTNSTTGKNYRYISSSSSTADGDEVITASPGRWHVYRDGYSCYLTDTTDSLRGADTPLQLIDDTRNILNLEYSLDGSAGKFRRYWVLNTNTSNIVAGKRIGLTVNNQGEDVSPSYAGLLKTVFEGYFDQANRELITTLEDDVTSFTYEGVVEPYSLNQNNFVLERNLAQNQAFQFKVYPEFDISQVSSSDIIPAYDSELTISPFIYANQGKPTDLGAFLGNAILPTDSNYRRVLPSTGLSVKVLSGSGIVNNYFWDNVPESSALGLATNTSDQNLAVNTNGSVYVVNSLAGNEDLRAIVSTASGESEISAYTAEFEGDGNPSITITVNYPSSIRANYDDVIRGSSEGIFNPESVNIYVRKRNVSGGNVVQTRRFTGNTPTNTSSDEFSFIFFAGFIVTGGSEPTSDFGLFEPITPTVDLITNTSGNFFYDVAVSFVYEGNSVTAISHKVEDGCISELSLSLDEIYEAVGVARYWQFPVSDIEELKLISVDKLFDSAVYIVNSVEQNLPALYQYQADTPKSLGNDEEYVASTNGTGCFVKISGGGSGADFDSIATFAGEVLVDPTTGNVVTVPI